MFPLLIILMSPNLGTFLLPASSFEPLWPLDFISRSNSVRTSTGSLVYSSRVATIRRSSTLDLTMPKRRIILKASSIPLLLEVP